MAWNFVEDGIIIPNSRVYSLHPISVTGRVLLHVVQSDFADAAYRGTIEFLEYIPELSIESPVIYRADSYSKAAIAVSPIVNSRIGFTVVFPPRSIRFGGMVYELFAEDETA